jgi:hypothetical protein
VSYVPGTIESEFRELYSQTVYLEVVISRDRYSNRVYSPPIEYPAHIEGKIQQVRTIAGNLDTSMQEVSLFGAPEIGADDRVTMPDGKKYSVLSASRISDENGWHHTVVYI